MILWRDPRTALLARVFFANVALIVGGVALLAFTLGWPPQLTEDAELAAWALGFLLIDYLVLRSICLRRRTIKRRTSAGGSELTARELEIISLIAHSYTAKEIAEMLYISPKTVDAHRAHILKKLGLKDRVALTRYAIRRGLVEP